MTEMNRRILALAIPNIISNISVPLLSLADTAIAGRMTDADSIGAVAIASMLVNFTYWLWGFLRMASTGFTAQAYGRADRLAQSRQLSVGTILALAGSTIVLLLTPILTQFLGVIAGEGSARLVPEAERYLRVAYLSAPAALLLYVYNGWFVGMQNTVIPMWTTIGSNILNIALSVFLVRYVGMGVEGIAWGTVVAQYIAVGVLLLCATLRHRDVFALWSWRDAFSLTEALSYIHIAKYLLLRTLMLGSISLYFIHAGSSYGTLTLGANALLMQLFTTFSYFMDGFAYAGEALTGRYIGAQEGSNLRQMLISLGKIGLIIAPLISLLYWGQADRLLYLLSDKTEVLQEALRYQIWVVLIPIVSFAAFLWDGVFVGATSSKPMMQAVALAWITFFVSYLTLRGVMGANALWLSFVLYLLVRSVLSTYWGIKLCKGILETS